MGATQNRWEKYFGAMPLFSLFCLGLWDSLFSCIFLSLCRIFALSVHHRLHHINGVPGYRRSMAYYNMLKRPRADGTVRYRCTSGVKEGGKHLHRETRTFGKPVHPQLTMM